MRDSRISLTVALALWACLTRAGLADEATVANIESMLSSSSKARVTTATLDECNLVIETSYIRNITTKNHTPRGAKKALKTVWDIDLSTVERVEVAPVHGDMHVGFWPPRRTLVSRILGRTLKVDYSETIHYTNGAANEQIGHISAGVVISKAPEPDLNQLLSRYIATHCEVAKYGR